MIRKLPPHLVHQIAAGEVVERPASALKELLENALDAGATRLKISYEGGGLKYLSVEDNGNGISAEDLPLAFEAHATSKLEAFEDFESLETFGFRGEALSSMGAVGDLEIWTTASGQTQGSRGRVSFGVASGIEPADRRVGTLVTLRDLFARLPARLKFLKSERSETLALTQMWKRYALAYPEVDFEIVDLATEKKIMLPRSRFIERVQWYFDSDDAKHWLHIQSSTADWKIEGWLLRPRYFEKVRSGVSFYLNRRPFKDQKLEFALRRGLEGFSLFPKNAAAVFYIEGSPKLFDVNVHPTKIEVRFTKPDDLFSLLVHAIRDALAGEHLMDMKPTFTASEKTPMAFYSLPASESERPNPNFVEPAAEKLSQRSLETQHSSSSQSPQDHVHSAIVTAADQSKESISQMLFNRSESFEFLGAIDHTYLLTRRGLDLWVFDQHALHERILYEKLLKNFEEKKKLQSQRLLFPLPLKFEGAEILLEREELLSDLGFEVRAWNDGQLRLLAAPSILKRDHSSILCRLVEGADKSLESILRDALASIACHSAVRAHDVIDRREVEQLLMDFESEDALGYCPHGRPTFVRLQSRDFEKMFQRIV